MGLASSKVRHIIEDILTHEFGCTRSDSVDVAPTGAGAVSQCERKRCARNAKWGRHGVAVIRQARERSDSAAVLSRRFGTDRNRSDESVPDADAAIAQGQEARAI